MPVPVLRVPLDSVIVAWVCFVLWVWVSMAPKCMHAHTPALTLSRTHCAGVPAIGTESVEFLNARGVEIKPLQVLGAEVTGLDLRKVLHPYRTVCAAFIRLLLNDDKESLFVGVK